MKRAFARLCYNLLHFFTICAFRPRITFMNPERKSRKYEGPVIFVGNHTSHSDGTMTSFLLRKSKAWIMVAKDWYEQPKFNWFLRYANAIPTERFGTDTGWLRDASKILKDKGTIIMFPEGKTNKTEPLPDEFKSGFIMLAMMTGAKIVPFAIDGKYYKVFGPRQHLILGEPTELTAEGKAMKPEYMNAEAERFRQMIISMRQEKGALKA